MGTTRQIPRSEWKPFLEEFSHQQLGDDRPKAATVEVMSLRIGDQYEARLLRLRGMSYDPRSQVFSVMMDDVEHLVSCPAEVWVIEDPDGLVTTFELACPGERMELVFVQRTGPLAPLSTFVDPLA